MSFGTKLRKIRNDRGLSIETVSKALGIGVSTLSEYENDITRPSLDRFFAIVEFYRVTENYFYTDNIESINIYSFSELNKKKIYAIISNEIHKTID